MGAQTGRGRGQTGRSPVPLSWCRPFCPACRGPELTEGDFSFLAQNGLASKAWVAPSSMTLQEMEKQLIVATIERTGGNIKESAAILGIDRSTMYEKIKRYEISR